MVITIITNLHGGLHKGWLHCSPSQPLLHSQDEELGLRNYNVRTFRPKGDDDGDEEEVHSQNEQVSLRMMCNYDVML